MLDLRPPARVVDALRGGDRYRIIHADRAVEEVAQEWLRVHDEREYSFVDAVSFEVMRSEGITDALTFDGDFEAAGFTTLVP